MEYELPNQNQVAYNIINFIKFNTRFIHKDNKELIKSVIDSLSLTDGDVQARALVLFVNAYNAIFNEVKTKEDITNFVEKHKEFTVQVSALCTKRDLQNDCHLNNKIIKQQEIPNDGEFFIFLGAPLFMKGTTVYDIDGKIIMNDLSSEIKKIKEHVYIAGKITGESYDFTD